MDAHRKVVIGTRGSELALVQADITALALHATAPDLDIETRIIETRGDADQRPIPLDQVGKGWFTGEIEAALVDGSIDLAVHSLKDMADTLPVGLIIGAYLPREDARDALITKNGESLEVLASGAIVGTDSARRKVQVLAMRPGLVVESLRGNVPTRLQKLDTGKYGAVILAVAGLKRLGIEKRITRIFTPSEMTPAPGQGTMAVQIRESDTELAELLARVNDIEAERASEAERSFSRAVGGGCKSPTGAYAWRDGDDLRLIGMVEGENGAIVHDEARAPWNASAGLGERLAFKLLAARDEKGP